MVEFILASNDIIIAEANDALNRGLVADVPAAGPITYQSAWRRERQQEQQAAVAVGHDDELLEQYHSAPKEEVRAAIVDTES
jgi:peptidyl-tRNA hydrolase